MFAGSHASTWHPLINDFILRHIAKCTVTDAHRQLQDERLALTTEELETFIAAMYAQGATGKSALPLHDLWTENWGVPLCKSAMSRNRFCEILRFFRFDVKSNRLHRLHTEKFALFSKVWTHFTDNCCTNLELLPQSTSSSCLAKSDALSLNTWLQSQINLGKNIG